MEIRPADVASHIFERNPAGRALDLRLPDGTTARELFTFCADLLCKGLVLLVGRGSRLDLDTVTADDFARVAQKLLCAGIRARVGPTAAAPTRPAPSVAFLEPAIPDPRLQDYSVEVVTAAAALEVRFELVRTSPR